MFDIGFAELLIIGVVGLVVLGPDKLPVAAKTVGLWVGKARRTLSGIQSEINEELRLNEITREVAAQKEELDKELDEMRQPLSESLGDDSSLNRAVPQPTSQKLDCNQSDADTVDDVAAQTNDEPKADDRS